MAGPCARIALTHLQKKAGDGSRQRYRRWASGSAAGIGDGARLVIEARAFAPQSSQPTSSRIRNPFVWMGFGRRNLPVGPKSTGGKGRPIPARFDRDYFFPVLVGQKR